MSKPLIFVLQIVALVLILMGAAKGDWIYILIAAALLFVCHRGFKKRISKEG